MPAKYSMVILFIGPQGHMEALLKEPGRKFEVTILPIVSR